MIITNRRNLSAEEILEDYFLNASDEDFLDALDFFFHFIDTELNQLWHQDNDNSRAFKIAAQAGEELNFYLNQNCLGYEFINSQLIRIDTQLLHNSAVKPALRLLYEEGFEGAEDEIRQAYSHRRGGNNKQAILEAGKAFESTLKTICNRMGYSFNANRDTASKLLEILKVNRFFPNYLAFHLDKLEVLIGTLSSALPTIRNKTAGHGQGDELVETPDAYVDYALNLAATNISFLVNLYKSYKN